MRAHYGPGSGGSEIAGGWREPGFRSRSIRATIGNPVRHLVHELKAASAPMSLPIKLAVSVAIALMLTVAVSCAVLLASSDAGLLQILKQLVWHALSNDSFKVAAGAGVMFFILVLVIFDCLSIICFRFRWDSADYEMDVYGGPEGSSGPKLSTRYKATIFYPFLIAMFLFMVAVTIGYEKESILKLTELAR
jgi:hypothetical protein